jgi:hypothetical protein
MSPSARDIQHVHIFQKQGGRAAARCDPSLLGAIGVIAVPGNLNIFRGSLDCGCMTLAGPAENEG